LLADIVRFNKLATTLAQAHNDGALMQPLQDFLDTHGFGETFRDGYLLPMLGCIWSCPTSQMLQFPAATMVRFCDNHGLLQVNNRPQWFTVRGGSKHYVQAITQHIDDKRLNAPVQGIQRDETGVRLLTSQGVEAFDEVIIATHADQALRLLSQPSASAPCCTPTPVSCRTSAWPGLLGITNAVLPTPKTRMCVCTTGSINCNPCRSAKTCSCP
jgi:predicted NAD/FAD-binding protein